MNNILLMSIRNEIVKRERYSHDYQQKNKIMFDPFQSLMDNSLTWEMELDLYRELLPMERQSMKLLEKM